MDETVPQTNEPETPSGVEPQGELQSAPDDAAAPTEAHEEPLQMELAMGDAESSWPDV